MLAFQYQAINTKGKKQKGTLRSSSIDTAREEIKKLGLFPTQIHEIALPAATFSPKEKIFFIRQLSFSNRTLGAFTRQLAILTDAGIPLVRGLKILQEQEKSPLWQKTISQLIHSLENGAPFSESLAQHPKIFSKLYVNMIKAGEMNGDLANVLTRLADLMEKMLRLKKKVVSALIYPAIVILLAIGVLTLLLTFIAPKFKGIFATVLGNKPLPVLTQWVIDTGTFMQNHALNAIGAAFLILLVLKIAAHTSSGALFLDKIKLKIPLIGDLLLKNISSRFCRVLETLIASGVPLLQSFLIARETTNNATIFKAIGQIHHHVQEGETITTSLRAHHIFPPMMINMIQVGEETGELPEMLKKVADIYEEEVDLSAGALAHLLEPVMIITLALFVGTIVIALFLPLVTLITDLSTM